MENHQLINQNSMNVEWFTPRMIVAAASEIMGGITLDPACSVEAYTYQKEHSDMYYYEKGLSLPWHGNVWLNPPFGTTIKDWIRRMVALHQSEVVDQACCITFNSTETDWGQMLLPYPQFFFKRRVNYIQVGANGTAGSTKGSVFTYLPPKRVDYDLALAKIQNALNGAGYEGVAK